MKKIKRWYQRLTSSEKGSPPIDLDNQCEGIQSEIFKLSDECLHKIFERCDLESLVNLFEVCKRFKNLFLEPNGELSYRHFEKFKTLRVDVCETNGDINATRKYLQRVGPFVEKIIFRCNHPYWFFVDGYLMEFERYAGVHLCELELINVQLIRPHKFFERIRALTLKIENFFYVRKFVDLQTIFPNVTSFEIKIRLGVCTYEWDHNLAWPTLRFLSMDFRIPQDNFVALLKRNRQLKGFKLVWYEKLMLSALHELENIERLEIEKVESLRSMNFLRFSQLNQLTLKFENTFYDEIIETITNAEQIRELKLMTLGAVANEQALLDLIQRLPHLQELCLYGISIKHTTVVHAVIFAEQLKKFRFSHFDGKLDRLLLSDIAHICKIDQRGEPLEVFLSRKIQLKNMSSLISEDDKQYIRVHFEELQFYVS